MNKKALSETDIRTKFITPALTGLSGEEWDLAKDANTSAPVFNRRSITSRR